jgi:hypothetical protein
MGIPIIEGSTTTKTQALTDILESITLEEAAIGHILNAEGEKLQRIIHNRGNTTQDLLYANQSVDNLANTLTDLTMLLKSKTALALKDKCYANVCDPIEPTYSLSLATTDGSLTARPNTQNEYDLVVDTNNTFAAGPTSVNVTLTTTPPTTITILSISGVGVHASALSNVIIITPNPIYEGTVTALVRFGESEIRIIIHVTQSTIDCSDYTFDFATTNGTITQSVPYIFTPTNTTSASTIQVKTIPASSVTLTNLTVVGNITVTANPNNTFNIVYLEGFSSGSISATVDFGDGCSRNIVISVLLPCSDYSFDFVTTNGSITQSAPYIFTPANTTSASTIQLKPIPASTVTLTNLTVQGNITVTPNPNDTFNIIYLEGFSSGSISATVNFGDGCSRNITISVLLPCSNYALDFVTTNGSITPSVPYTFTPANITLASTIQVKTIPASSVTLTNLTVTGNITVTAAHNDTFNIVYREGFSSGSISATVNFGGGCSRNITISVLLPCSAYTLDFVATNGSITKEEPYIFTPAHITSASTIQVKTIPASTVTLTNITFTGNITVTPNPNDTFNIVYLEGFSSGSISATVNFGDGCSRNIVISVLLPCSDYTFELVPTNGSIAQPEGSYIFTPMTTASASTIQVKTIPESIVSLTIQIITGGMDVTINNNDTFSIKYPESFSQGFISATVTFGDGCSRDLYISVLRPCNEYKLAFETTNGSITSEKPYIFNPADTTKTSTIQVKSVPARDFSFANLTTEGNIHVTINPDDTFRIDYLDGFYSGSISATLYFVDGCSSDITISVLLPCDLVTITAHSEYGTLVPDPVGDNHYIWTFPSINIGDDVVISTNPDLITGMSLNSTTLPDYLVYITPEERKISVFNEAGQFPATLSINVDIMGHCTITLYFAIDTTV